jgi:glutathione S-transferase
MTWNISWTVYAKPACQIKTDDSSMPYVLYWNPFSGSLAPMAVLEEIGAHYEKILIDMDKGENRSTEYLKIHPLGFVPAIRLTDGRYAYESAGICMYLADRHPECGLAPPVDDPGRAIFNQWMLFLADTIYPAYGRVAHPERYSTDPSDASAIKAAAVSHRDAYWRIVEESLEDRSWLVDERCSVADIFVMMLSTWHEDKSEFAGAFPNVARVAASAAERSGVQRALRLHRA